MRYDEPPTGTHSKTMLFPFMFWLPPPSRPQLRSGRCQNCWDGRWLWWNKCVLHSCSKHSFSIITTQVLPFKAVNLLNAGQYKYMLHTPLA